MIGYSFFSSLLPDMTVFFHLPCIRTPSFEFQIVNICQPPTTAPRQGIGPRTSVLHNFPSFGQLNCNALNHWAIPTPRNLLQRFELIYRSKHETKSYVVPWIKSTYWGPYTHCSKLKVTDLFQNWPCFGIRLSFPQSYARQVKAPPSLK